MNRLPTPVLIYDGDCGICREWVDYWLALTGGAFTARPFQQAAADHPHIPLQEFEQAIQLVEPDGTVSSGAGATFRLYRGIAPWSLLLPLYRHVPGFRPLSEWAYGFLSRHRGLLAFLTHLFWGRNFQPVCYALTARVFLVLFGLLAFSAFVSFGVQAPALIGARGVLPLHNFLEAVHAALGLHGWVQVPTLFWLNASDTFIQLLCAAGAVLSLFIVFNLVTRTALLLVFLLYLSLVNAGQTFMNFQWDMLLLEACLLAIFVTRGSAIAAWLYRWLVFRFMFLGGVVKIVSRDPAWDSLTALNYHFETQPLPVPAAWFAHHLPETLLKTGVAATLFVELVLPFLVFAPRRFRMIAGWTFILFQGSIIATGNYNFFNLLTIALCLFLFDDAALRNTARMATGRMLRPAAGPLAAAPTTRFATAVLLCFTVPYLWISAEGVYRVVAGQRDLPVSSLTRTVAPCRCINTYGPFAVMTTARHEIVIEGSNDGAEWREYGFRYKPGALDRISGWIIPHQPRIDWQMWFAALSNADRQPWFRNLMVRLLQGGGPVPSMFRDNPFPDQPPLLVRALFYRYEFTTPAERAATGNWWKRRLVGEYHPPMRLQR
jgi:predicted DCC family thiol-disulfide oxidoreductase YuxK